MIGVDPLRPGMGSFHAMFSSVDHLIGSPASVLIPFIAGPRHAGQFSAETVTKATPANTPTANSRLSTADLLGLMILITEVAEETEKTSLRAKRVEEPSAQRRPRGGQRREEPRGEDRHQQQSQPGARRRSTAAQPGGRGRAQWAAAPRS